MKLLLGLPEKPAKIQNFKNKLTEKLVITSVIQTSCQQCLSVDEVLTCHSLTVSTGTWKLFPAREGGSQWSCPNIEWCANLKCLVTWGGLPHKKMRTKQNQVLWDSKPYQNGTWTNRSIKEARRSYPFSFQCWNYRSPKNCLLTWMIRSVPRFNTIQLKLQTHHISVYLESKRFCGNPRENYLNNLENFRMTWAPRPLPTRRSCPGKMVVLVITERSCSWNLDVFWIQWWQIRTCLQYVKSSCKTSNSSIKTIPKRLEMKQKMSFQETYNSLQHTLYNTTAKFKKKQSWSQRK